MRSSSTLPPLQSLRAFEAVARLLSFRRAGEELLITQSAVSHHIRRLEEHLGARLFIRRSRDIALTQDGERYFRSVNEAFAIIAAATGDLRGPRARSRVRVSLLPSFAANWLVPRLGDFTAAHPELELILDPTVHLADLNAGDADLAIRFGDGNWNGMESRLVMEERITPVASPALLSRGPPLLKPQDVVAYPLLMVLRPYEWELWAEANHVDLTGAETVQLTDYNIALQAALDAQGIAIARLRLIGDRLRSGALIQPFPQALRSPRLGHWLVWRRGGCESAGVRAFSDWITRVASDHVEAFPKLSNADPA
jgi:LysR family glycine cleavage system transcriptional activator